MMYGTGNRIVWQLFLNCLKCRIISHKLSEANDIVSVGLASKYDQEYF